MALFCNLDYAGLCCKAHFPPKSPRTIFGAFCPLLPFLLHLIVKTGFMSLKDLLDLQHSSSISRAFLGDCQWMLGTSSKNVGHFSKNLGRFSKNVGDFPNFVGLFPKNVGVFFSTPRSKEANGQETMDSHIYKASAINKQESSFLLAYKKLHFQFF